MPDATLMAFRACQQPLLDSSYPHARLILSLSQMRNWGRFSHTRILAMPEQTNKRSGGSATVGWYLVEMAVYAVFVLAYYLAVLHTSSGWLKELFDGNKPLYAVVALALIVGQVVLLELVTTGLFRLIRGKSK
jgi:hypothetical protein